MNVTDTLMLIRPANFGYNPETALTNSFQKDLDLPEIKKRSLKEFDRFTEQLKAVNIQTIIIEDTDNPAKPDAVFPNNWISFHPDGKVILYPMQAVNRRLERRTDILNKLREEFEISEVIDLTRYENERKFLEGTGSVVFDHSNRIAYASLSPRTDYDVLVKVCSMIGYEPFTFRTYDSKNELVYHTNVMMCIAGSFAVVCLESVDEKDRERLKKSLEKTRDVIVITPDQMNLFAGNMLYVKSLTGDPVMIMSLSAFKSLNDQQLNRIEKECSILPVDISTIETIGGGSARCMLAEVFLPSRST